MSTTHLVLGVPNLLDEPNLLASCWAYPVVDSAITLAIAVDALGAERVQAVMMPSRYTSQLSLDGAADEARPLGVHFDVISIEAMFETALGALQEVFAGTRPDATEENIQARCRGLLLMAISNKTGRMVLTTGNKSEMAVGYATLYGDMAGGFAPLGLQQAIGLSPVRNTATRLNPVIPAAVIERPPSAELRARPERHRLAPTVRGAGCDSRAVHRAGFVGGRDHGSRLRSPDRRAGARDGEAHRVQAPPSAPGYTHQQPSFRP